uniref:Uncharacterized protein n=1 Tax=Ditylenchus dipsaci TaxID=166011 RepID=A0A915E355_9BILA
MERTSDWSVRQAYNNQADNRDYHMMHEAPLRQFSPDNADTHKYRYSLVKPRFPQELFSVIESLLKFLLCLKPFACK